MIVGFTGTQIGMSDHQRRQFIKALAELKPHIFHHGGDCVGADEEADKLVRECRPGCGIFIHPPVVNDKRAHCPVRKDLDKAFPPRSYLARNRDIVVASKALIAAPKSDEEEMRSGTWSTVRFARKWRIPIWILER